ncbi:MAG: dUTP diphosphatase [Pseudomonadales bacterium]|nr:dUTP diphosphatase [Pseudomonadales bacterium]
MLSTSQAKLMLSLQANMNARINAAWITAGYPYLRAVVVEGAEAMEHHGWKWWKKQACDLEQLRMELVDIWHFTLSHILLEMGGDDERALALLLTLSAPGTLIEFDNKTYNINELDTISKLELNIGLASARRISIPLFEALLSDCQMDWNELFCQYVGKNVLNFFRQDHGYQEGTYNKLWGGREDNEHLVEIMTELDSKTDDFQHQLYSSLKDRYETLP